MNKNILIGLIVILISLITVFYFSRPKKVDVPTPGRETQYTPEQSLDEESTPAVSIEDMLRQNDLSLTANLVDVTGGTSEGVGYIQRSNGDNKLVHTITATLPDLKDGYQYEGWLVKKLPKLEFFSTGILNKDVDGKYKLLYFGEEKKDNFNFVVITKETTIDETPETHIIEGLAK